VSRWQAILSGAALGLAAAPLLRLALGWRCSTHELNGRPVAGWRVVPYAAAFLAFSWAGLLLHVPLRLLGRRGCFHRGVPDDRGSNRMLIVTPESFTRWPDETRRRPTERKG
jgi:hypothetical protein